jgi:hypothetical protein
MASNRKYEITYKGSEVRKNIAGRAEFKKAAQNILSGKNKPAKFSKAILFGCFYSENL